MNSLLDEAGRLFAESRLEEAQALLLSRVDSMPGDQAAQFLLGLIELERGGIEQGLSRIEQHAPDQTLPAGVALRLAQLGLQSGRYESALTWLRMAREREPRSATIHYWLANALRHCGDMAAAEAAYRESISLDPAQEESYVGLAFLYQSVYRYADAANVMRLHTENRADDATALQKAASFLEDIHRVDLAEKAAARALAQDQLNPQLLCTVGRLRGKLGAFEDSAECFRRALQLCPTAGEAMIGLAAARKFSGLDHPDAHQIQAVRANSSLPEEARICAGFAMGKILDDCAMHDAAFSEFSAANAMHFRRHRFDEAAYRTRIDALIATRGSVLPAVRRGSGRARSVPVFVVGMPRSGTTLVESMLAAHPNIFGAGELNYLGAIAETLGLVKDPSLLNRLPATDLQQAAVHYLQLLGAIAPGSAFVVDKNPGNLLHLGLVATLFPDARIICCTRDPLDTGLSIYFQHFARAEIAYAYDLETIAAVYLEQQRLMAHWKSVLPMPILELNYEELVRRPEAAIRGVLEFIGAGWDPACLEFHHERRSIGSASLWQARQPLYRHSVGRAASYMQHLQPLRRRLGLG